MLPLVVPAILAAMPAGYEIDFGTLAPAPKGSYEYTLVLSFPGEPDVRIEKGHARRIEPQVVADDFMESMNDPRWRITQNGTRVTIFGYDDVPILKVTAEGKGPSPVVRRVIGIPPDKKK